MSSPLVSHLDIKGSWDLGYIQVIQQYQRGVGLRVVGVSQHDYYDEHARLNTYSTCNDTISYKVSWSANYL